MYKHRALTFPQKQPTTIHRPNCERSQGEEMENIQNSAVFIGKDIV